MPKFLFDVKLFASIYVDADSEEQARQMMLDRIHGKTANLGSWDNGDPILADVSFDDVENDELIEIDGEAV
jgi:hypothetical protein